MGTTRGRIIFRCHEIYFEMKAKLNSNGVKRNSRVKTAALELVNAQPAHAVVALKERRLLFGDKWDYAPAPEDSKNYVIAPRHELFINGKFVAPSSGKYFESINPATEQTLTTIAAANADDVDSAVKSADRKSTRLNSSHSSISYAVFC